MKQKRHLLASRLLLSLLALLTASTAGAQATIGGITYDAEGGYYVIDEPDDLLDLATYVNGTGNYRDNATGTTAHDCQGLKFKMTQNITFTYSKEWNEATTEEDNNFVAIGGYYGSTNRYFRGDLDGAGLLTLNFTDAPATIAAGTPFIIKWDNTSGSITNPVFQSVVSSTAPTAGKTVTSTDGNVRFEGQYSPFDITADNINEILYVASGNKIGYSKSARTLKPFRAHFWVKPKGDAQAARMINIDFGDGETTSISTTNFTDYTNSDGAWYSIDGRKLDGQPTQKGVYVKNGKKIIVK